MVSNESRIRFHAAFETFLDDLVAAVAKERERDPENYKKSPQTKLLARVYRAIKKEIPARPLHAAYHQGDGRGQSYTEWKRAKLSQQYRLFFKCLKQEDVIIYGWLNSGSSLRKYRTHAQAYLAFRDKKSS